jgi:hypothetical protein
MRVCVQVTNRSGQVIGNQIVVGAVGGVGGVNVARRLVAGSQLHIIRPPDAKATLAHKRHHARYAN